MDKRVLTTTGKSTMNSEVVVDKDAALSTAEAWGEWLAEQECIALQVYEIKPSQLVADQRREQGILRDYKGREILELLQNAADAAKKANKRGSVQVELTTTGLLVANTGVGFTTGGVSSLQTADLSPKRSKNSNLIGSKGLGFRSILNWSQHPVILSGALQLAYNTRYAEDLIGKLANRSELVRNELENEQAIGGSPIPLLPFPIHLDSDEIMSYVDDLDFLARCQVLKAQGYDTVIAMPFDRVHSFENAYEQLQQLRPEFLFFSEWIETLSVNIEGEQSETSLYDKTWNSLICDDETVVLSEQDLTTGSDTSQRWRLFSDQGEIPAELLRDSDDPDNYHLVVALQENGLAEPANLYSFFPTSIPLPLHALCHASLELEQNRKHLQEGGANRFVLHRLAEFLADIFEQQVTASGDDYRAIDLLAPANLLKDYPEDIRALQTKLIGEVKAKKILPAISGDLVFAEQASSLPSKVSDFGWLPETVFSTTVIARNYLDKCLFDKLGVGEIGGLEFERLMRGSELTIEQRASVALGLIDNNLGSEYCYKGLLLDAAGNELSEQDSIYLPGASLGEGMTFPDWANLKVLNDQLWGLLRSSRVRDSAKALSVFGVQEYSLVNLIAGLISSANRAVKTKDENMVRSALLSSLYELYRQYEKGEYRPGFPPNLNVFLLNQKNEWIGARQLYSSSGYSIAGDIVGRLYVKAPGKLVAKPSVFWGFGITPDALPDFLHWLGLETWPKVMNKKNVEATFLKFTSAQLKFPVVFAEGNSIIFKTIDDLPSNCNFQYVQSLDGIDDIVTSDSDAILAWLANDARLTTWLRPADSYGKLSFVPSGHHNDRVYKGELPSYIHWKIRNSPWLSSSDGKALAPVDCMVNDAAVAGLFPRPVRPSTEVMGEYSLNGSLLKHAWINAGVREGIEDLESEEIYALLAELPYKDPMGKLAKKLYNWLIKTVDFELDVTGENYLKFIEDGAVLAHKGDTPTYFPVKEAYHVDIEGFPSELLKSLPVACLLKKRGAEKVRRLFGVNVLDKVAVNEKVIHHSAAACTGVANNHFQLSKKYIEIYRHNHSAKPQLLRTFNRLELVVCSQVQSQITFKNEILTNHLPPWTYSIQADQLFVSCDPTKETDAYNPLLANTIGDAVASIFSLNEGTPFAQIYQCDEPSRPALLGKMLGDELDGDLDAMLQALNEEAAEQELPEPLATIGPVPAALPTVTSPNLTPEPTQPVITGTELGAGGWNVPPAIGIESVEHLPESPGTHVGFRVSGSGGGSGGGMSGGTAPISDGKAGESLAMLFEEEQGRFPLYIGHITGYETIAADLLSFRCARDKALFESGEDQSSALIERVIEAKEKWSGGRVRLTSNEVNTASEWREKYYIYRFTPINTASAEYELKMLNNPMSQLEAVASSIEISLDTASTSLQFRVYGKDIE